MISVGDVVGAVDDACMVGGMWLGGAGALNWIVGGIGVGVGVAGVGVDVGTSVGCWVGAWLELVSWCL